MKTKKWLSILLVLCMALSLMPTAALAEEGSADAADVSYIEAESAEEEPSEEELTEEELTEEEPTEEEPTEEEPVQTELTRETPAEEAGSNSRSVKNTGTQTWTDLRDQILNAENGSTITLDQDYTGDDTVDRLLIETGKTLTIDLNGHTINRNRTIVNENGHVIVVQTGATLTIMDSSGNNSGVITGGFAYNGGGINNSGILTIAGGTITGNKAVKNGDSDGRGGGIANYGSLVITGGVITANTAEAGGGIGVRPGSTANACTVSIRDCSITNNSAAEGGAISCTENGSQWPLVLLTDVTVTGNYASGCGGAIRIWGGTVTLNSGTVSGNTAGYHGGAVYVEEEGILNLLGGTISGNHANKEGGAILVSRDGGRGIVNVSGSPVVQNNTAGGGNSVNNVYLRFPCVLTVTGALGENARIGVTIDMELGGLGIATEDFRVYNQASALDRIVADDPDRIVCLYNNEADVNPKISYVSRSWQNNEIQSRTVDCTEHIRPLQSYDGNSILMEGGWYYVSGTVTIAGSLVCTDHTYLILCDGAKLTVGGLYNQSGHLLVIYGQENGSGKLESTGSGGSAGIGGTKDHPAGWIEIYGGTITAVGDTNAAGIGGGNHDSGYDGIRIYGGTVKAQGGSSGAGIGKGQQNKYSDCGTIAIYGGYIETECLGSWGAGIGGGEDCHGGTITINGGRIIAQGGASAPGIGSGGTSEQTGQVITINGGEIDARGGHSGGPGIGGAVRSYTGTVTINGGTVRAYGAYLGAGIGGGYNGKDDDGIITIKDGHVTATGGSAAAGIGGGFENSIRRITIDGGIVHAYGGQAQGDYFYDGAGIGGSANQAFEATITINGGDVLAKSNGKGAGIGAAQDQPFKGSVLITGGTVRAISGNEIGSATDKSGAGIGAGYEEDVSSHGTIKITGGTVTAESNATSASGAGIGAGTYGNMEGTIWITGGTVTSISRIKDNNSSGHGGAGIGAGCENTNTGDGGECSGKIKIEGGTVIAVTTDEDACAIGFGHSGDERGTRSLYDTAMVTCGYSEEEARLISYSNRDYGMVYNYCRIEPCSHAEKTYTVDITNVAHEWHCTYCGASGMEEHSMDVNNYCTVCGYQGDIFTIHFDSGDETTSGTMEDVSIVPNSIYILPDCTFTAPAGMQFKEWSVKIGDDAEPVVKAPGNTITVTADTIVTAVWEELKEPVFRSHQLILSGQIGMHFYMSIPEGMTDGTMTFTVGDRTITADGALQSDGRYKFTCYVNSVEMAEDITATYTYTSDNETKTVTDTTSVKAYLEVIINNKGGQAAYTAATPLAKAIYNYGHYAMQAVPGGSKHPEMPDTYTGDATLITSLDGYAISATLDKDVITKASYSLDLDSETAINFYLTTESELTTENVSVTAPSGTTFGYTVEKVGSRYRVQITGIGAHELGTVFTLTSGETTISASAMTYVQQRLANANASTATKNAAAALYAYYQEAISYNN